MVAMKEKVVVILPMYNEEDNASLIVDHLNLVSKKHNLDLSIIAVNDGSKDGTGEVLQELKKENPNLITVSYPKNKGLGGAVREGIEEAKKRNFAILFFMDADLTHNGEEIPKFLKKMAEGYDLVLGSRFIPGGKMIGVPFPRVLISQLGNLFGRVLLGVKVKDFTTGYRAVRENVFDKVKLEENGFGLQLEETVKASAAGFRLAEVPIILTTRRFGSSKMVYDTKLIKSYYQLFKKCWRWSRSNGA